MAQPEYSNGSSSTDTDEEWEQDAQTFAIFVQQTNATSSIPRSRAPNIDKGRDLNTRYPYFQQQYDAAGLPSFSPLQKCTTAIRQLAYGISGDAFDEYVRMGATTTHDCLNNFCSTIIEVYGQIYLRKPTYEDVQQLYAAHEDVTDFPACSVALTACIGNGGIARLHGKSPLFEDVYDAKAPDGYFQVNRATYKYGYYLGDGIYPKWATLVKSFSYPEDAKRMKFKKAEEAARKDVERAFGVLQKRWSILVQPARGWEIPRLSNIMAICVVPDYIPDPPNPQLTEEQRMANVLEVRNQQIHHNLRADLVEHIWPLDIVL
ncbi:hypothetical protein OSB04_025070 [Centaurea solstitialis]|uniref:DDE Tnp4 domain-containing protein n=1 Tax=Centaurea solstitialis TaxID=347529 RepID=A0AA38T6T2_9ASTR|nr:hypothetical protein OSB04_025070 [Centaurea solstitialis]